MLELTRYNAIVFDCDGVVLNSNQVKTNAFYQVALKYGKAAANRLVTYHVNNGGISRYIKFKYFIEVILEKELIKNELDSLVKLFADEVAKGLLECEIAGGLAELRELTSGIPWLIVSGGDQEELRSVFSHRVISDFFLGGIFGSPDTKEVILSRELNAGNITLPALFLGDSNYDYVAAKDSGLDFLFISDWSEYSEGREKFKDCNYRNIRALSKAAKDQKCVV